ncbi:MAG: hypothetical protein KME26_07335 [Oscillatoria princeps RMCB-10]|jgi:pimeloyl-ACP methyl ester carboxylesterase|nr:hypothetical protein [Oscillatoria princeps RMCB-10]
MRRNPLVLIHGYSSNGRAFQAWEKDLEKRGYDVEHLYPCNYLSLTNEVTVKDIAEGFDRALRIHPILKNDSQPFDAIVHSTGMLVIRSWLTAYGKVRRNRLKRLIGFAPASFGSPLAHKGRSWLGSLFKGNRMLGPDFLEAGDKILESLELGSRFTWDLAHKDLTGNQPFYGANADTPYVFIFCGTSKYDGIAKLASETGTDGTVRWAGSALNTRKLVIDLTKNPELTDLKSRLKFGEWVNAGVMPVVLVDGLNHSTILSKPTEELVEMVSEALQVSDETELKNWYTQARQFMQKAENKPEKWQQFVIRAVDERDDPITDYNIELFTRLNGKEQPLKGFDLRVHTNTRDKSLRCFYMNLDTIPQLDNLWMRLITTSGSALVIYHGFIENKSGIEEEKISPSGMWIGEINLSELLKDGEKKFFYPFTTTLVELRFDREPTPLGERANRIFRILEREQTQATL